MSNTTRNLALLSEILQFHPQLLLDDVINVGNETIYHAVEALEVFLLRWAEGRGEEVGKEVDQGLYAFQTLLESYSDTAFDTFEVWALRNVFALPPSDSPLPLVLPHHAGLDLKEPERDEIELRMEVDELRAKVENARRLNFQLKRANALAERRLSKAKARVDQFAFLRDTEALASSLSLTLPNLLPALLSLPDPSYPAPADTSKRPWETSSKGYLNWGIRRLVDRGRSGAALEGLVDRVEAVGEWDDVATGRGKGKGGAKGKGKGRGKGKEKATEEEPMEEEQDVGGMDQEVLSDEVSGEMDQETVEMGEYTGQLPTREDIGEPAGGSRRADEGLDEDDEDDEEVEMDITRITDA